MALKVDYVARETANNLRRNITLTVAAVLTVAVSLSLFGCALLVRQGVENATARWKGGIEFIVYLKPDSTQEQRDAVRRELEDNSYVDRAVFVDQEETFSEFKDLFARSPQMVETVTPAMLPPSYRVVPTIKDAEVISGIGQQFVNKPGVYDVVFAYDTIRTIQKVSNFIQLGIFIIAIGLLGAALLLILNTIRMAMFARRREIEVMKLVGATNWFIRVPFMLEGVVQGILGSAVALIGVLALDRFIERLSTNDEFRLFEGFVVGSGELTMVAAAVVIVGVAIGAVGSAVAVSRFLDV